MPNRDGTGPWNQSSGQGQGNGQGQAARRGMGRGAGRGMGTRGLGGNNFGAGPGGDCVCPKCGTKVPHQVGSPCNFQTCPQCGSQMVRG